MKRFVCLIALLMSAISSLRAQEPSLFMNLHDFAERSAVADREPWAHADFLALIKEANSFPHSYMDRFGLKSAEPPPEGGQWLHWYVCPESGRELIFRPPNQNICPDTGKNFTGYPIDHVVYQLRNDDLAKAAVALALTYRFTHQNKYASQAASILKAYADIYPHYALHDNFGKPTANGAKAYSQTLDESIWLIKLAWTYDLIRGSNQLTDAEKKHLETDLLLASASTVMKAHKEPTDNIQSWINGAVAAVGYTLHDAALIHEAIDGPIGFRYQMHHFVQQGFWIEDSWAYQFYAMRPLVMTAQMAARNGTNLWKEEPALLTLFHSPLGVVLPDGTLPPFNDSKPAKLYEQDFLYEIAYAAMRDPLLLPVLEQNGRTDREALLFGVEKLPSALPERLTSQVFDEAGFVTLRSSTDDFTAIMKFGPHGGAHGHYDKLGFILFAYGRTLGIDPGTQLYGLPLHREWDSMTVAHNTIAVDELRQAAATGKLLRWHTDSRWTAVTADAGDVYTGASLERTLLLTPDYVLVIDHAISKDGKPHIFDWNYHNIGMETLLSGQKTQPYADFPNGNGYNHLMNPMHTESSAPIHIRFVSSKVTSQGGGDSNSISSTTRAPHVAAAPGPILSKSVAVDLKMIGTPDTEFFTGDAPGPDLRIPVPFLIVRRKGTAASFVALLTTSLADATPSEANEIRVKQTADGEFDIDGPDFSDAFSATGELRYVRKTR